jgi:large subunit ribosomal protein L19
MSDEEKTAKAVEEPKAEEATEVSEATDAPEVTPFDSAQDPGEATIEPETTDEPVVDENDEAPVMLDIPADEELEKLPGTEIHVVDVKPGMTIRLHEKIKDLNAKGEERERVQIFQGMVIGIRGAGDCKTMTIRRQHKGYGTEKIYPLKSPVIAKIELVKTAKVRRAKLGYLQSLKNRFKRKLKEVWAVAK